MPIISVEQFRASYLNPTGSNRSTFSHRNLHNGPKRESNPIEPILSLIFCADDCDSILALRILKMYGLYTTSTPFDFDIMYVSSLDDVYEAIEEQQKYVKDDSSIQLKPYSRIILLGFGAYHLINMQFFATIQNHFLDTFTTQQEKDNVQFWVFDYRRPFLKFFENETESWFLILDDSEYQSWSSSMDSTEVLESDENATIQNQLKHKSRKIQYASSSPNAGLYFTLPICHLMNQIVSDLGTNKAIYAKKEFLTSISLFWHYLQQHIDTHEYEELLSTLRKRIQQDRIFGNDEFALNTQYGMLPFLQYSSLEEALCASDRIFVKSQDETEELRENQIRMKCGVTKKEMKIHQSEFRITNKEIEVQQHLHEKYGDSPNTIDWARLEYPDLNNAALAHVANFILSYNSDNKPQHHSNIGNCRDFQHIIDTLIKTDFIFDPKAESQLLQAILPASQLHLNGIFSKIKYGKFEAKKCGGEVVWLFNFRSPRGTHLHPMQLRLIALLSSSYKSRGDRTRCSSIILSASHPFNQAEMSIYAINPNADKENPDPWPSIIYHISLDKGLKQNTIHPSMATIFSNKLTDIRTKMLDLYKRRHLLLNYSPEALFSEERGYSAFYNDLDQNISEKSPLNKKLKLSSTAHK